MAAASAAIDRKVPIDVMLDTGRWADGPVGKSSVGSTTEISLEAVAPSIGTALLA